MPGQTFLYFFTLLSLAFSVLSRSTKHNGFPNSKIYGVNLGSWLVLEPWMLPAEWEGMGGEVCSHCSDCIGSEFAFAQAYPETVDQIFDDHWTTWFNQSDVNTIVELGLNTVRIPLGYWIVEPLVNRTTEFYPKGGIKQLKRGVGELKAAGVSVILDHHALPGVQTPNQSFAGRCTTDVEFYTPYNYQRALIWSAVMTALSHIDPDFSSVFALEAVNEPIMDASQTPSYDYYQTAFVQTVRAVEAALEINSNNRAPINATDAIMKASNNSQFAKTSDIALVLAEAAPILGQVAAELGIPVTLPKGAPNRQALYTNFMDVSWQYNDPPNPADAQNGPQAYDNHLYYSFGGVADANPDAYMSSICNLHRVQTDAQKNNSPLWFGEWGLSTQFNATDSFLDNWADAQKRAYSAGAGWIFWNFKTEISEEAGDLARQWSYFEGVRRGYLTKDPSQLHNPLVCDNYTKTT